MRIQVLFNGTPVVVPCGDGKIPVRDLIEKAVQRYKKLPNKSDLDIEVKSVRLKDSDAYVDQDDEVAEALQDNEMVILEISIRGGNEAPPPSTGPQITPSSSSNVGIPPGIPPYPPGFGPSPSQEELRCHMDDSDPHVGGIRDQDGGHGLLMVSSQDDVADPWNHRRASTPPPPLTREWNSGGNLAREPTLSSQDSAIAMMSSKSQDDHTPSLRADESFSGYSQEDQFRLPASHSQSDFNYHPSERSQDMPKHSKRDDLMSVGSGGGSHGNVLLEDYRTSASPRGYRRSFSGVSTVSSIPKDTLSPPRGKRKESQQELRVSDSFHGRHELVGSGARGGGAQHSGGIHSERSSISSTDTGDHTHNMHHRDFLEDAMFKRVGQEWTHTLAPPNTWRPPYMQPDYLSSSLPYPTDRYPMMDPRFDQRSGYPSLQHKDSLRGRYPGGYGQRPHLRGGQYPPGGGEDQQHHHGMMRSRSHDRALDEEPPHIVGPGHYPPGPYMRHNHSVFDEGSSVEYYLSQPAQSYDRPPSNFPYHPNPNPSSMMVMMGGPSGYALSQPVPVGMYGGGGGGGGSRHNSGSFGSVDRKSRPHFADKHATLNENDLDPCEEDEEEGKGASRGRSNHFKRDYRTKSIYGDGLVFGKWMDRLDTYDMDNDSSNELPQFDEGDASQSQRSPSPDLSERGVDTNGQAEKGVEPEVPMGTEEDLDNIPIVELTRDEDESYGIQLVTYTSPDGKDLGVFVGGLEKGGVAARSGKLSSSDRILACNGMDFTDENMTNERVEQILMDMLLKDPMLRMAISRGLPLNVEEPHSQPQQQETPQDASANHTEQEPVVVNAAPGPTNVLSNTRRIGVKHTIHLVKGQNGLGFGITSRDVSTNTQSPIYVKSINADSPASKDGHLRIGDRLLEVNGTEVSGMSHSEVLQLLRSVSGTVELVVSRQETVEGLEEDGETPTTTDSTHPINSTATVGKTLINVEIPLRNNGSAGLGITVHGRSKTKGTGTSGIYIKSIMPGGATARDGRLQRNDQIVCIGTVPVMGKTDQEALDILKKALADASSAGESAKLKLVVSRTVGINRKANLSMGSFPSQMAALGEVSEEEEDHEKEILTEVGIDVPQELGSSRGNSQPFDDHLIHQEMDLSRNSASEDEPSRGSVMIRGENGGIEEGPPGARRTRSASHTTEEHSQKATPSENDCLDLTNGYEHGGGNPLEYSSLSLSLPDQTWSEDMTSLDRHSRHRPYNSISSAGQAMPTTIGHTSSTSSLQARTIGHTSSTSSLQARTRHGSQEDERTTAAMADNRLTDIQCGAPVRGSNRRNKPERGSGRQPHQSPTHSLENSVGVYATLPRHSTTPHSPRSLSPTNGDTDSLCSLEEGNQSSLLSRHNRWRISITKKTKKDYLKDLQQYRVQYLEPEIEEAGGMIRTSSDGCLSNNVESTTEARLLDGVEVGPALGMVKSSSLESLHNVYKHTIKLDSEDKDSRKHRQRGASFSITSPSDGKCSPALVSIKKSPGPKVKNSTAGSKPGIFNFFKKRKAKKEEKVKKTKFSSISMPVSRNSTLLEEVHPMINHDNHSPHEAYLSQQGREQPSASSSPRPSSNYGNDSSEGGDDDEDSTVLASMARV